VRCDYRIATGPFDGDKATSSYSRYARLLEYTLKVRHNDEGAIAFVEVGQRTIGGWWTTLGRPGTGP
jgi:hypothetical protein